MNWLDEARERATVLEQRVIGALVNRLGTVDGAADHGVTEASFRVDACRVAWNALVRMADAGVRVTPQALADELSRNAMDLDVVGGAEGVLRLREWGEVAIDACAPMLADINNRRDVIARSNDVIRAAADFDRDDWTLTVDDVAAAAELPDGMDIAWGDDIAAIPPPVWMVDGLLQDGLSLIIGRYGAGKSLLAADLAVAISAGQPWHEHPTEQRRVLYVAAEGRSGMRDRMYAAADDRAVSLDGVGIVADVDLSRPGETNRLASAIRRTSARVLVLDTWARVLGSIDENSPPEVGKVVAALDRVRFRTGCAIIVVHHIGKSGDDARGATALPGAADSIIRVTYDEDDMIVVVDNPKKSDRPRAGVQRFRISDHLDAAVLRRVSSTGRAISARDERRADGMEYLRDNGMTLVVVLAQRFGQDVMLDLAGHPDVHEIVDDRGRRFLEVR